MGAMPEEIQGVIDLLEDRTQASMGMRTYYSGYINGVKAVVVFSRWGKVAAAATVATLVHVFKITELIFTGVAGALSRELQIGDVVIAGRLVQHDMDVRPLMPQYEIPLLQKTFFECEPAQLSVAKHAADALLQNNHLHTLFSQQELSAFNIVAPRAYIGDIASGDQFFAAETQKAALLKNLPGILCVEMEGAAVAQVCYENGIPFTIARTISDTADDCSPVDFPSFINTIAGKYSRAFILNVFKQL